MRSKLSYHCLVSSGFWKSGFNGDGISPGSDEVESDGWRPGCRFDGSDVGKLGWRPLLREQDGRPHGHAGLSEDTPASPERLELSALYLWARESIEVASDVDSLSSPVGGAPSDDENCGIESNIGLSGACGASGVKADDVCDW